MLATMDKTIQTHMRLELCRRSFAAAGGFISIATILLFTPQLPQNSTLFPWYRGFILLAIFASCMRLIVANWISNRGAEGVKRAYHWHAVTVIINALSFSAFLNLSILAPQGTMLDLLTILLIMFGMAASSATSLALEAWMQHFFLVVIGVIPTVAIWLYPPDNGFKLGFLPISLVVFLLYNSSASRMFRLTMYNRYRAEEMLKIEKDNLQLALRNLQSAQDEILGHKARVEYASRLASLGEMAGGIAHEINNPLAAIMGHAEQMNVVLRELPSELSTRLIPKTDKIQKAVTRISRIIQSLRHFSRSSENEPLQATDLGILLDETLELCRARFEHHQVELIVDTFPREAQVVCRSVQISQVLLNLLNNAFDAVANSPEKKVHLQIHCEVASCRFAIQDSGSGIDPGILEKIFNPFFTTKPIGKGTGLGLSISRMILEEHGSQLKLDRSAIGGARFSFTLPVSQSHSVTLL